MSEYPAPYTVDAPSEEDAPSIQWQTSFDGPLVEWFICDSSSYYIEMNTEEGNEWYIVDRDQGNEYYSQCKDPPVIAGPFDDLEEAKAVYVALVRLGGHLSVS